MQVVLYRSLFIFILIASCAVVYGQPNKFQNKIVAVVNEDVITQADLDVALASVVAEYKKIYRADELTAKIEEARQEILNQMIEEKLILQEAKRRKVEVDDAEVEERLNDVRSRFPNDDDFNVALNESGLTFDVLRNRYKEQIMMHKLVNYEIRGKTVVTPSEISEYFAKHTEEFIAPESVRLKNIVIRFEEGNTESLVKQKADDVYRLLREGRDFSDITRQYSQGGNAQEGGDLGFIGKGQMRKEFDDAVFKLEAGEITFPIKTQEGYYIFKVEEKREGYARPLSEVREDVENLIFQEKAKERYKGWIDKLKRDAFIQIK
ncbi:MAG: peptidylprolyl isomerase [Candidatus Omnitrophota bacterium]